MHRAGVFAAVRLHHLVFLLLAVLALGACVRQAPDPADASAPLLPGFATKLPTLETIELRTAGDRVAVTLERGEHGWTVRERTGWPADPALVRTLLEDLATARRIEAKTAKPERHARIGVDPVASPDAAGVEVRLRGKDWSEAVVVGDAPPAGDGRFVRVAAQGQAWRVDKPFAIAREPAAWLDTRLFDVPLARIAGVHSFDASGHAFALAHRDDRFRIVDAPSAAMGDSYRGDTLAGVLGDLRLEDVAVDDGRAAERTVDFTFDGNWRLRLEAWRVDGRVWVRVRECPGAENKSLADCAVSPRWHARRFLLPAHVTPQLLLTRDQILGRTP
jgi:hypothetical protein